MTQLDLFPPPAPPPLAPRVERTRKEVMTRAGLVTVYADDPQPFEIEVAGVTTVISYSGGFCTRTIDPPGSPYWSETGFRSFGAMLTDPVEIADWIQRYIDAPTAKGGCGGQLTQWWPGYVRHWRQSLAFELSFKSREEVWNQWGPEQWEDSWHRHDMKLADAMEQMREDGIDPNAVGKPSGFRGKWPRFEIERLNLQEKEV